ncbi:MULTISPECIES: tetratricopeptide repeat protein [Marichromatium]|uniref:Sel1 repeat-containing protein n=1 Tax=Marichromatium gracile TaxID=1048 RepID=A0A4R4ACF7_MARGR|nr:MULTISPECIES: sel1 repeat family protein [Marichromatium]MBK1710573.1 hypothetical protein [Marichromatium gracile]RNE88733.1 sel1 repeat family protein [Marichromatium sp. AB31]TCW36286.1 hypothetical protein EDC29_10469 [Marichromatium gracile]
MPSICLNTASAVTGLSRRTLQRYIQERRLTAIRDGDDGKTRVELSALLTLTGTRLTEPERTLALAADQGDPGAQYEFGVWLLERARPPQARDWFQQAARAGHADAMCWLGRDLVLGEGGTRDEAAGSAWLGRAAARGSALAQALTAELGSPSGLQARAREDLGALEQLLDAAERRVLLEALQATAG